MKPRVSICIPAYKQPESLKTLLDSISTQNFNDYEIIITDDSPDNILENIIAEFEPKEKLRYIKNKRRLNSPENWNESMRHAKGEYVKIIHHDDSFANEYSLARYVEMLDKNPKSNFAFSSSISLKSDKTVAFIFEQTKNQLTNLKNNPDYLFKGNVIGAPSTTIFRNGMNMWFDQEMRWLVDIDFYIRMLRQTGGSYVYSSEPLVRIGGDMDKRITSEYIGNKEAEIKEYLYLYRKLAGHDRFKIKYLIVICRILIKHKITTADIKRLNFPSQKNIDPVVITAYLSIVINYILSYTKKCIALFKK